MSVFRRIMLGGGLNIDIDSLPETQKIYYTATAKVAPKNGTIGTVLVNNYNSKTGQGIMCFNSDVINIGDCAFELNNVLNSIIIPDSVTTIRYRAFHGCSKLTSVTIGDSVTTIGNYAFSGCYSLTSITIPNSVTEIGMSVFSGCTSLQAFYGKYASEDSKFLVKDGNILGFAPSNTTTCNVPEGVSKLDMGIFTNALESLTLPSSIVECSITGGSISVNKLYCKANTPPSLRLMLSTASFTKIYVPMDSVDAYKAASEWSNYSDKIFGYNF